MPTTHKRDLRDFIPAMRAGSTRSVNNVARQRDATRLISVSATAVPCILRADAGSVLLHTVSIVPDTALAGHATDNWTLEIINKGAAAAGTTQYGDDFITTLTAPVHSLVAFVDWNLFNSVDGVEVKADETLVLSCTKNASAAALPALLCVIEYTPLID